MKEPDQTATQISSRSSEIEVVLWKTSLPSRERLEVEDAIEQMRQGLHVHASQLHGFDPLLLKAEIDEMRDRKAAT